MANIGKVNVQLSVDPAGTKTGIQAAINDLQRFETKIKSMGSGSSLLGGALGALPVIPTSFVGALAGTFAMVERGSTQILALSNSANRLGVSMRDAAAMQVLFGDKADAAFTALDHLNKGMGGLRAGSGGDFQKAVRSLGLDDKALAQTGTTEAAKQITARIGALSNSFDKANATQKIFGKGSVEIGSQLERLGTNFDAAAAKVDRFGLAVSETAAQDIRSFKRSIGDIKLAFEGLERQSAATFAKPLAFIGDWLSTGIAELRLQAEHLGNFTEAGAEKYNKDSAKLWNDWRNGANKTDVDQQFQNAAQNSLMDSVKETTAAWDKQFETLGRGAHISQTFAVAQQYLHAGMAPDKVKETMGPLQEYARTLDEIDRIKSAPAGSRDIFQDADRKIAALNNLAADSGFDPETTERAGDAIRGIHVELDRMAEAARSTLEQEMQTPAEKLSARLEYLKKLFNTVGMSAETMARATKAAGQSFLQGMGVEAETPFEAYARKMKDLVAARKDLGEDVFGRGVTGLFDNLAKSSGLLETKLPTAAEQGSREAFSAIHQFEAGAQGSSPSEILQQILTQQNARAAEGNAKLQEIIQALKDFNVVDFG